MKLTPAILIARKIAGYRPPVEDEMCCANCGARRLPEVAEGALHPSAAEENRVHARGDDVRMMITRKQLYLALIDREPWHPRAADWRKLPNGRIFRFVKWNWKNRAGDCVSPKPHAERGHLRTNAASIFTNTNQKETNND